MELRRGAFFDRDGVINASPPPGDYVRHWDQFRLLPETVEWIRRFNALGAPVIVVTNQRGVSRGIVEPAELESIHENMRAAVAARGGRIDDVFCCPHEENACQCRKPLPGLVWRAAEKFVTHNRFFEQPQDLCDALFRRFDYVRHHPQEIEDPLHFLF